MQSVLFCCTGNIFRSVTAEYGLRRELQRRKLQVLVSSAGTEDRQQTIRPYVRAHLESHGLDVSPHARRTLTRTLVDSTSLVIAMSVEHQHFIEAHFNYPAPLFLALCGDAQSGEHALPDVDEAVPDYLTNKPAAEAHMRSTIDCIIRVMPRLADRICAGELERVG
jgi:protein-tyrosine phosphatase